jgi:hypothetical protein
MTTGSIRSILVASVVCALAVAPAAAQQRGRSAPSEHAQTPASLGVHGFSVVLVVGGMQGASASDNVPEAARKALADMKDFLPYKRYQLLDAAWILCCAPDTSQVSGRVRGPDGRDYLYTVDPGIIDGTKLNLRFTMREVQDSPTGGSINVDKMSDTARLELLKQQSEAARELDEAELQVRTIRQRFEVGTATPADMESATMRARRAQQRVQELQRLGNSSASGASGSGGSLGAQGRSTLQPSVSAGGRGTSTARAGVYYRRELMDSSFMISAGETVVIGTSRLNGDQALIAILTAATKPAAAAK